MSAALGIAFVIVGTLAIIIAAIQHQRFVATLPQADLPGVYSRAVALVVSLLIAALGMFLAGYLADKWPLMLTGAGLIGALDVSP